MSSDFTPVKGGETFEQIRHNLSMSGIDEDVAGIMLKPNYERDDSPEAKKKKEQAANDAILDSTLRLSQQLAQSARELAELERDLAKKYGEDFALNLAAEFLDNEEYKEFASIKDFSQRNDAVARRINSGIDDGTIDKDKVAAFGDMNHWLQERADHAELEHKVQMQHDLQQRMEPHNPSAEQHLTNALSGFSPSP